MPNQPCPIQIMVNLFLKKAPVMPDNTQSIKTCYLVIPRSEDLMKFKRLTTSGT